MSDPGAVQDVRDKMPVSVEEINSPAPRRLSGDVSFSLFIVHHNAVYTREYPAVIAPFFVQM